MLQTQRPSGSPLARVPSISTPAFLPGTQTLQVGSATFSADQLRLRV